MKCPKCENELSQQTCGDIELDICGSGCGGVWFDEHELLKFDEPHEFPGLSLLEQRKEKQSQVTAQRTCPKCANEPLVRQFFDAENEVEIDQCWSCAGIWLDIGELATIRAQFETYEDRAQAVNSYIDDKLGTYRELMNQSTQEDLARYNEQTKNRFQAGLFALKQLLGLDDPYDNL